MSTANSETIGKNPSELYCQRLQRVLDAVALKNSDRIPLIPQPQAFPVYYAGFTIKECLKDYRMVGKALDIFYRDFQPDLGWGPNLIHYEPVLDACGINWMKWPGHGIEEANQMYQFIEGEYMEDDEYDEFIHDPTHFIQSKWLPRSFKNLKGLENLRLRNSLWMGWMGSLSPFASHDVIEALDSMKKTAERLLEWFEYIADYEKKLETEMGIPVAVGSHAFAPFDHIGDTMRGTYNILTDMLIRPEKLLKALEVVTPIAIEAPIEGCRASGRRFVWIWLHKGVDEFISVEQYKTFYWPGLKKLIEALVADDLVPIVYCEGKYNTRLEILRNIPCGKVVYDFEYVDMEKAKETLGDVACIAGNVPNSMLAFGSADEVDSYCKNLIKTVGRNGGFMLDAGALIDNARPENLRAMFESVLKYSN